MKTSSSPAILMYLLLDLPEISDTTRKREIAVLILDHVISRTLVDYSAPTGLLASGGAPYILRMHMISRKISNRGEGVRGLRFPFLDLVHHSELAHATASAGSCQSASQALHTGKARKKGEQENRSSSFVK